MSKPNASNSRAIALASVLALAGIVATPSGVQGQGYVGYGMPSPSPTPAQSRRSLGQAIAGPVSDTPTPTPAPVYAPSKTAGSAPMSRAATGASLTATPTPTATPAAPSAQEVLPWLVERTPPPAPATTPTAPPPVVATPAPAATQAPPASTAENPPPPPPAAETPPAAPEPGPAPATGGTGTGETGGAPTTIGLGGGIEVGAPPPDFGTGGGDAGAGGGNTGGSSSFIPGGGEPGGEGGGGTTPMVVTGPPSATPSPGQVAATDAVFDVAAYGAVGDGVTNDTLALQRASAALMTAGGGTLRFRPGTYIVGLQTFAGANGKKYAYKDSPIVKIENCQRPVVIEGNGAVLKAAAGLKYGAFDPVTGLPFQPEAMPFTKTDFAGIAYAGMIRLINNADVTVRSVELDGNVDTLVLGGTWGDKGRQLNATGLYLDRNKRAVVDDIYTHHHGLDGIYVSYRGAIAGGPATPHTLSRIRSEYNGRQAMSWVGGIGLTVRDSRFNHTGRARFVTAPGSGLDVEATNAVCRDGRFENCEFLNNVGCAYVSESGDGGYTTFANCTFAGTTNWALWPNKPGLKFEDCTIYGPSVKGYGSTDAELATQFRNCRFADIKDGVPMMAGQYLINFSAATNIGFQGCSFDNMVSKGILLSCPAATEPASFPKLLTSTVHHRNDSLANKSAQSNLIRVRLENTAFTEGYATPPANGYYIAVSGCSIGPGVTVNGPATLWKSWSLGTGGKLGLIE